MRRIWFFTPAAVTAPLIAVATVSAPQYVWQVQNTSQGTPLCMQSSGQKPIFNPPQFAPNHPPINGWLPLDTSRRAFPVLGGGAKPIFNPAQFAPSSHPIREWLPLDTSQRAKPLLGGGAKPRFNFQQPPTPDLRRSVVDTSHGIPKGLYQDSVRPFFNPPPLMVERKEVPDETSRSIPDTLSLVQAPPFPNTYLPAPSYIWQLPDTSRPAILSIPAIPVFGQSGLESPQYIWNVVDTSQSAFAARNSPPPPLPPISSSPQFLGPQWVWNVVNTSQSVPTPYIPPFVPPPPVITPSGSGGGGGGMKWPTVGEGGKVPKIEDFPYWKRLLQLMDDGMTLEEAMKEALKEPEDVAKVVEAMHIEPAEVPFVFPNLTEMIRRHLNDDEDDDEILFIISHFDDADI